MPIKPENRAKYPANWSEIRERIRARSSDKCEWCGVNNHAIGYREHDGTFVVIANDRVEGRDAASSRRVPSHDGLCP